MSQQRYVDVEIAKVKWETDDAFLFVLNEGPKKNREVWVPKSQMENPGAVEIGDEDVAVDISAWFVDKEKLQG